MIISYEFLRKLISFATAVALIVVFQPLEAQSPSSDRQDAVALQEQLKARGCYHSIIDGIVGPHTRSAFSKFAELSGTLLDISDFESLREATEFVSNQEDLICLQQPPPRTKSSSSRSRDDINGITGGAVSIISCVFMGCQDFE